VNIDLLVHELDPIADVEIPEPDLCEAGRICAMGPANVDLRTSRRNAARPVGVQSIAHRRRLRGLAVLLGVAALLAAVVAIPLTARAHSSRGRLPGSATSPSTHGVWSLAGYITRPGWNSSSGLGPLPTTQQFTTELTCPTATTCYTAGTFDPSSDENSESEISVTHDAGSSWNVSLSPGDGTYFFGFTCPTETTCMVIGSDPTTTTPPSMYETTDGGATWTSHVIPGRGDSPMLLSCASTSSCVALEYVAGSGRENGRATAYVTSDDGDTWAPDRLPQTFIPSDSPEGLQCLTGGRCIVTGSTPNGSRGQSLAAALYSTNGGATWASGSVPSLSATVGIMSCTSDTRCTSLESADDAAGFLFTSGVLVSADGGQTWTLEPAGTLATDGRPGRTSFDSISCSTASTCWVTGQTSESTCQGSCPAEPPDQAVIMASDNGGQTWSRVPVPAPPSASLQYAAVFPVSCPSASVCFAVGTLSLTQSASSVGMTPVQQDVVITDAVADSGTLNPNSNASN
jgi:photosystem II stability/assembly factor-like uncharacterized protein